MSKIAKPEKSESSLAQKSGSFSQIKNERTGHWIKKDASSGQFVVNRNNKPFEGIKVIKKFKSASNPSISKEIATLAEKAVLEVLNKSSRK